MLGERTLKIPKLHKLIVVLVCMTGAAQAQESHDQHAAAPDARGEGSGVRRGDGADRVDQEDQPRHPMDRKPTFITASTFVRQATKQHQQVKGDDVARTCRLGPERDERVADGDAALEVHQGHEYYVRDQEQ